MSKSVHSMIDEYFNIYIDKIKEYGEKTAILFQVGSFFECYRIESENLGNADKVSEILHILYSNKNKILKANKASNRSFPDFCGFTISYLPKYCQMLLEANYTVVVVEQLEESSSRKENLVKRGITHIYSPSLPPIDESSYNSDQQNLVNILIEPLPQLKNNKQNIIVSICYFNNSTNTMEISENCFEISHALEEINRIMQRYSPNEINVYIHFIDKLNTMIDDIVIKLKQYTNMIKFIDTKSDNVYKNYIRPEFQNEYLRNVFKHIEFGLLQPIEYMELDKMQLSIINLMLLLDFIAKHDQSYIVNLNIPKIIHELDDCLVLELNTMNQLNLFSNNSKQANSHTTFSLFDIINHTKTVIGKRALKHILSRPFNNTDEISKRYQYIEELSQFKNLNTLGLLLDKVNDIEYYHRKMSLNALHPFEFKKLDKNYNVLLDIMSFFDEHKDNAPLLYDNISVLFDKNLLQSYIQDYNSIFNLNEMNYFNLNNTNLSVDDTKLRSFFNTGVVSELDQIQDKISIIQNKIENIRKAYDELINTGNGPNTEFIKMYYTEQEGFQLTCTKIRYQLLLKKLAELKETDSFQLRTNTNTCKFTSNELIALSKDLINYSNLFVKKIKAHYIAKITDYYTKYSSLFVTLKHFIELIDVIYSNVKCKELYNFCKPEIVDKFDNKSFFEAKKIWHPIVEKTGVYCVPNDVTLSSDNLGILLYGINAAGKSTLLRSIGISIVLAQSGLYVPCESFTYYPFDTMISQVDLTDDIFKNKSSFIVEMTGLKRILNCAGPNTIVLSDELCKGTENYSAIGIVCSTILQLVQSNTKFFFTTHLHSIQTIPDIINLINHQRFKICHLSVSIKQHNIIFDRIMKPGSGSELYGIEISKAILNDISFIDKAFEIRNQLIQNKKSVLSVKKSVYNKKKIVDHCEICNSTKHLETHHISPQCDTDINGKVTDDHYHKNSLFNLAILCKKCHDLVTYNKIIVHGYKHSLSGKFLDYTRNN